MTLLISVISAVVTTIIWYLKDCGNQMKLGTLSLMYWAASLMWMVDAVFEYVELQAEYFKPAAADMLNDAFLGVAVVTLGLVIWLVMVLVKDPKGNIRRAIRENKFNQNS